jgi:endonuclease YncB( thermonuclease family)
VYFERARDGDTVEVRGQGTGLVWAIRLIDVWAPELHTGEQRQQAAASKAFVEEVLHRADPEDLLLKVPLPKGENVLKSLTFDRIPGYIWIGDVCLNELIVAKGYASSTKAGVLGE